MNEQAYPEFYDEDEILDTKSLTISSKKPNCFKVNWEKVDSLEKVIAVLKSLDMYFSQNGEDFPKQFEEIRDMGLLIPMD